MGNVFTFLRTFFNPATPQRILMLGLDAAGKTTVLYALKLGERVHTVPTIGFNVEEVKFRNLTMNIWDVGGQDRIRPLWKHYFRGTDALVYVLDTNDPERFDEARDELHSVLSDDRMNDAALLVLANKMDLPNAKRSTIADLAVKLELNKLRDRQWFIQPCSATQNDGLIEGLMWLHKTLNK